MEGIILKDEDEKKETGKGITWLDFARVFDPNITNEEVHDILMEHTAFPFGGFLHNARLMKEYFENK